MAITGSTQPIHPVPAAVLAVVLAGCGPSAPPAQDPAAADRAADAGGSLPFDGVAPGERINFQCSELAVGATFDDGGETVRLSYSGQRLELPSVDAASGVRYADDGGNQFWSSGNGETALMLAGEPRRNCVRSNRPSPWDVAADNGVGFRAVGQEPGWLVELEEGDGGAPSITAHLDYGQRLVEATGLERDGQTWSGRATDGTEVTLTVEDRDCADAMSGERFRAAAVLTVGGESYQGCGAWLDAGLHSAQEEAASSASQRE